MGEEGEIGAQETEQAGVKGGAGGKPEVREGPAPVVPVGGEPLVGAGVGGGMWGGCRWWS